MLSALVTFLVGALVLVIVIVVARLVLNMLPIPVDLKQPVLLIIGLLLLIGLIVLTYHAAVGRGVLVL